MVSVTKRIVAAKGCLLTSSIVDGKPIDFRSTRHKLPPEAFVFAPKIEPDPSDMVSEAIWTDITWLPDDVSMRTSEHEGSCLEMANRVYGDWVALVLDLQALVPDPNEDALAIACLSASDELQASAYFALTGFYRQAIATMRPALEGVLAGAFFRVTPDPIALKRWADGDAEGKLWVRSIRDRLAEVDPYRALDLGFSGPASIWEKEGWINWLYGMLSGFEHGRPFRMDTYGGQIPTTNGELWKSNGPIYTSTAFGLWYRLFIDATLALLILVALSEPRLLEVQQPMQKPLRSMLTEVAAAHIAPVAGAKRALASMGVPIQPRRSMT
jgi:hypothetical protein